MNDAEHQCALIDAARAGDRTALEELLLAHYDRLAAFVAPRLPADCREAFAVEDILQETFVQAFRDIQKFDSRGDGALLAWLTTIADRRLRDALRGARAQKRGGQRRRVANTVGEGSDAAPLIDLVMGDSATASRMLAAREAEEALQVALAGLGEDQRRAIALRYFDGHSVRQTANLMGRSEGAVRGLLARAREQLRDALGRASHWLRQT